MKIRHGDIIIIILRLGSGILRNIFVWCLAGGSGFSAGQWWSDRGCWLDGTLTNGPWPSCNWKWCAQYLWENNPLTCVGERSDHTDLLIYRSWWAWFLFSYKQYFWKRIKKSQTWPKKLMVSCSKFIDDIQWKSIL